MVMSRPCPECGSQLRPSDYVCMEEIIAKCQQYWNSRNAFCPEEVNAILEFIHTRADEVLNRMSP